MKAVSIARGRGNIFTTAAVMMPKRAFCADEDMPKVIAGIVLF